MEDDSVPGCCFLGRLGAFPLIKSALDAQTDLEDAHQSLLKILDQDDFDPKQFRTLIEQNVSRLQKTRLVLEDCRDTIPLRHRPTEASAAKAKQVLETAELFEHILLHAHPRDTLAAAQVTRATYDLFKDSPRFHDQLGLRRSENGFLYTAFAESDSDEAQSQSEEGHHDSYPGLEQYENYHFTFANFKVKYTVKEQTSATAGGSLQSRHRALVEASFAAVDDLPRIGTRCREMLIFQPIVRVMQVVLTCCSKSDAQIQGTRRRVAGRPPPNSTITYAESEEDKYLTDEAIENNDVTKTYDIKSKTGITVGDIYDATARMRDAHALCPHAPYNMHDEDGKVCPAVNFFSDVSLKNDDPYLIRKAELANATSLEDAGRNMESRMFKTYMQAKSTGKIVLSVL